MQDIDHKTGGLDDDFEDVAEINIRDIFFKYLYHWPLFVLGVVICLLVSFIYLRYTQPIYLVTSSLLIKEQNKTTTSDILSKLDQEGGSKSLANEVEILKSRTLIGQVVERLYLNVQYKSEGRVINTDAYATRPIDFVPVKFNSGFYNRDLKLSFPSTGIYLLQDVASGKTATGPLGILHKTIFGAYRINAIKNIVGKEVLTLQVLNPEAVVGTIQGNLSIENKNPQSTVLQLGYTTPVVVQGEEILNTLVQVYNEASLLDKNKTVKNTLEFLTKKLAPITGELVAVEKDVENFKSSQGITEMSAQADLFLNSVKTNDAKLADINIKLAIIEDIKKYVNANDNRNKLPSTMGIDDPQLAAQIGQLDELQLQKVQLLATTPAENPIFNTLNKQIESVRAKIQSNVKNIGEILEQTKSQITRGNAVAQGSIKKIPGQERQFISIKRQQETKEALYLSLLQKKEETELSYASAVADSRLIDPAIGTGAPIKPNRQMIYLASFLLGLILPGIYVFIKDLLNNKINSKDELSKITHAPILGELAFDEGSETIVVNATSRTAIAEQFRAIRTNLQFVQGSVSKAQGRVTLFTSSVSGEGKSFVATNLATVLAISGKKTVLLELDLRKPKVSQYLNLKSKLGLSNYLIGKAQIDEILVESGVHKNLYVIGSGPIPPNPSELLMQLEIRVLIDYLKTQFDEIIIDAPPVGLVTDAQILAAFADTTIYIARAGVTLKSQIAQFDKLYRQHKFPKLNLILNGIQMGGKHGYGYGYGYGYYSDDAQHPKGNLKLIFKDFFKRF